MEHINKIKVFLYRLIIRVDVKFRLYDKWSKLKKWFDVKLGYIDKTDNIIKCRYCESKKLECYDDVIYSDWCSVIERKIRCKECGKDLGCKNN